MIDTSIAAYNSIIPDLSKKQKVVLGALYMLNGSATNEEIGAYLGYPINTITPRTGELLKAGIIERGDKVKGNSGRKAYKYNVKNYQLTLSL